MLSRNSGYCMAWVTVGQKTFNGNRLAFGGRHVGKLSLEGLEVAGRLPMMNNLTDADGFRAKGLGDVENNHAGAMPAGKVDGDFKSVTGTV
jgi:hypothetical protein